MIIIIAGGVGSGKSLTAVKHSVEESKRNKVYTNFELKNIKNYHRLKWTDLLHDKEVVIGKYKDGREKTTTKKKVNWEFWSNNRNADIFLDEVHNIVNSRRAMSTQNVLFGEWISQIRKIWGSSGDVSLYEKISKMNNNRFNQVVDKCIAKSNNIYLITQKVRKLDINFKELSHAVCLCKKIERKGLLGKKQIIIINHWWFGNDMHDAVEMMELGHKPKKSYFLGNKYFKYYDSYEMIGMNDEYL